MGKPVLNYSGLSAEDRAAIELHRVLKRNRILMFIAVVILLSFLGFLLFIYAAKHFM